MRTSVKLLLAAVATLTAMMTPGAAHASLTRIAGPTHVVSDGRLVDMFDVAFDSVHQVYLAVWGTFGHGPTNGQFISAGGTPIGGPFAISAGAEQAGWARVTYGGGKFLVAYTKIQGSGTHRRAATFVTYSGGSPSLSSEIEIDTWNGGAGSAAGVAFSNGRYLVSWWTSQESFPQSYVTVLNSSGAPLATKVKVTTSGDGQTDPEIACDSARGRCLVVGQQWGVFNPGLTPGTWGQFIKDDTGELIGGGFTISYGSIQKEATVTYSAAGDRYLVAYSRSQAEVHGSKLDGLSTSVLDHGLLRNAAQSPEGVCYGMPKIVYNAATQSSVVAMLACVGTAVLELDRDGWTTAGSFQLVPGAFTGTKVIAPAADPANSRFLVADFQEFQHMRSTVFGAEALGTTPPPSPPPGPACSYTLSSTNVSFDYLGGGAGVTVTTSDTSCAWTASSNADWVTLSSTSTAGTGGPHAVAFSVSANASTAARSGTLTIAGHAYTVSQAGAPCTTALNVPGANVSANGWNGSVTVTVGGSCGWSAISHSPILTVQNGLGRSGNGTVSLSVAPNYSTSPLTATATIAGHTFTVAQAGATPNSPLRAAANAKADFNGDGYNDLVWQESVNGYGATWRLQGGHSTWTAASFDLVTGDPNWRIAGTGDFNGDSRPDILWHHRGSGQIYLWYMNAETRIGHTALSISGISDTRWRIAGIGDFNSDGKPDIVWQHDSAGWLAVWLMDGPTLLGGLEMSPGQVDVQWKVAGVADLNADGKSDLIWRNNQNGNLGAWLMNGVNRIEYRDLNPGAVEDQDWQISAVMDVNGDQTPDIVWHHGTRGWVAVWYMNGTIRMDAQTFPIAIETNWKIVGSK